MKAKQIYYKKLFSLGGYENEEIGVTIEIEEGETAAEVIKTAREYVKELVDKESEEKRVKAEHITNHPDRYSHTEYAEAQEYLDRVEFNKSTEDDLPF